jgi:hypothetical protein
MLRAIGSKVEFSLLADRRFVRGIIEGDRHLPVGRDMRHSFRLNSDSPGDAPYTENREHHQSSVSEGGCDGFSRGIDSIRGIWPVLKHEAYDATIVAAPY